HMSIDGDLHLLGGVDDMRSVLHHLNAGVVAHGADTSIRVCNPMACELLGLTMDQIIGVTAPDPQWMFLREDGSVMPLDEYPVNVVLRDRTALRDFVVGVNRPAKNDVAWVLCNGFPVLDQSGQLELAIITFTDITGLKKGEQERAKLEEQLRQALKMEAIGRLAGGVAHDFNNILTAIGGYAEMLHCSLSHDDKLFRYVEEIRKGTERASELTRQLLFFARKQVVQPQVIQPNEILARLEHMLPRLIGEDVNLVFFPAKKLHNIRCDPGQLDQILVNLAVNARDAMPNGGRVAIETSNVILENEPDPGHEPKSGPFVMVAISDDGVGMDAATKEHIFEPFFSTKATGEGTGLGLSTVYGIVKQHGGTIRVYSEVGEGTTFKVYFPAVTDDIEPHVTTSLDTSGGNETILLVEDDILVRELARTILSNHGYIVLEAADGEEALLLSQRFSGTIHLLLTDVVMPKLNGRQLAERILVERPEILVLYMSGYTENIIVHRGVLDDETTLIQKPFTVKALARMVREVLDS
ncbi:MAG: response regulator, partial [Proteobacteria bacterium]|nr:response regulator [Pseudomonadota bacterium]